MNTVKCLGVVCPVSQHELLGRITDVLFQECLTIPAWKCWISVTELLDLARPDWSVMLVQFALAREDRTLAMNTCTDYHVNEYGP